MNLSMGCRLLVVSTLLVLLIDGPLPDAAGKSRKVHCKGATVPVTAGQKTTCKPLSKALPKPRKIDLRLAHLQEVLKLDPAKMAGAKKRKRARTLQSGFGAAGRRAQKTLLKALPKALGFIDRERGARFSRLAAGPAFASAGCQPGPAGPTGHTGGATVGLLGDNGGYIDASAGGLRVRVTFVSCGGVNSFRLPECPTANGNVDGRGSGQFRATIEIWDGGQLVSRNSSVFEEKAKVQGEVGADARLKFIEVEHTQEVFIVASGGIVIRGGVTRKVRIDMLGGRYDPANASVVFFGDRISADSGASAFAGTADAAIRGYKNAEPRWSTFNPPYCAEPSFSPQSNTLKLRKGEEKKLSVFAKSRQDGGQASNARWTLLSPQNADFSPTSTEDPAPNISYTVTDAPKGGQVKVTVKFTSTAGAGEKTWTQPTEPGINHISGTFAEREEESGSTYVWAGTVDFDRSTEAFMGGSDGQYKLAGGTTTVTASGSAGAIGLPSCSQSGSTQVAVAPADSGFLVLPRLAETYPYPYTLTVNTVEEQHFTIQITGCPKPEEEGSTELPATFSFTPTLQNSADGIGYSGSETIEEGTKAITRNWSFHGTE
ncbi:MAG TPA: hypothetical protein VN752_05190 [Solirubrobacterales bacterium]|nr:hypothetical protein [Solirubrobacterales bacterium]